MPSKVAAVHRAAGTSANQFDLPALATQALDDIKANRASFGGQVNHYGQLGVDEVEYGPIFGAKQ